MPIYNEADGIAETVAEVADAILRLGVGAILYLQNDASSDDSVAVIMALPPQPGLSLSLESNARNLGHGPTLLQATRRAFAAGSDVIVQLDGDGQFHATDVVNVVTQVLGAADFVLGVRQIRHDPWYRRLLTRVVRLHVRLWFGAKSRDPNSPLRAYSRRAMDRIVATVPDDALIPNIYATAILSRSGLETREVQVRHRVRRGSHARGTTWRAGRYSFLIPRRLLTFSLRALRESLGMRQLIAASAP